jgi:hypothetical protein
MQFATDFALFAPLRIPHFAVTAVRGALLVTRMS